jgi:hypothetical protein
MKILKGCAVSLLSFLFFLSLALFGVAFMVNQTALNPHFVTSELNRLDIASLVEETMTSEQPSSDELTTKLAGTIPEVEPLVKEKTGIVIYSVYDYLLGKSRDIDLALTLRNSLLSKDFILSAVDELDIPALVGDFLNKQLIEQMPAEVQPYITEESLSKVISELKPWMKEQINSAADPVLDYLVGKRQSFNVTISLEPVKTSLGDTLKEEFLKSPPPELAGASQAELEQDFDQYYEEMAAQMPSTFEIDQSVLGTDTQAKITEALGKAEEALALARQYIAYFQLGYKILIAFMVLLIIGIVLIDREVKATTRRLGIPLLVYGALDYAGIIVGKYFLSSGKVTLPEIPPHLETWMFQFIDNLIKPLEIFSLSLLICGAVLTIVSFVYRRRQSQPEG